MPKLNKRSCRFGPILNLCLVDTVVKRRFLIEGHRLRIGFFLTWGPKGV